MEFANKAKAEATAYRQAVPSLILTKVPWPTAEDDIRKLVETIETELQVDVIPSP